MPVLLRDLVFIDRDSRGFEYHRTYPRGAQVTEVALGQGGSEAAICRSRCHELKQAGDRHYRVMVLDGLPRILHRRFFDPSFKE